MIAISYIINVRYYKKHYQTFKKSLKLNTKRAFTNKRILVGKEKGFNMSFKFISQANYMCAPLVLHLSFKI